MLPPRLSSRKPSKPRSPKLILERLIVSIEISQVQPVFDPANVGASIDLIRAQIPIKSLRLHGSLAGVVPSFSKGDGLDIDGVRDYVPGDDPRHIDWAITARQPDGSLQIREHYRDVTPNLWLVTDTLQSRYAANPGYFSEQRLALSAIVAFLRLSEIQGMPSAILAANDDRLTAVRQLVPVQGRPHVRATVGKLVAALSPMASAAALPSMMAERRAVAETRPHLDELLGYAAKYCTKSLVVIVSDFRDTAMPDDEIHGWANSLTRLAKQDNDVIAVELTNPYDYRLSEQANRFAGEKSVFWVGNNKHGRAQRAAYAAAAARQQTAINQTLAGADRRHLRLSAIDPQWLANFKLQLRSGRPSYQHDY